MRKRKELLRIKKLANRINELNANAKYISISTTHRGVKGRLTGYQLEDGSKVGVFVQSHSNIGKVITTGNNEADYYKPYMDVFQEEGYPLE